jgi:hypothetical protein
MSMFLSALSRRDSGAADRRTLQSTARQHTVADDLEASKRHPTAVVEHAAAALADASMGGQGIGP